MQQRAEQDDGNSQWFGKIFHEEKVNNLYAEQATDEPVRGYDQIRSTVDEFK